MAAPADPWAALGVSRGATDAELRSAYRKLAQRWHPDHNNGSVESAHRFAEVQEAYAAVRASRAQAAAPPPAGAAGRGEGASSDYDARIAEMERELAEARAAKAKAEQAREHARRAAAQAARSERGSDEELGYVSTDDSFTKIFDDWAAGKGQDAAGSPAPHRHATDRLADIFDDLGARLRGDPPERR